MFAIDEHSNLLPRALGQILWTERLDSRDHPPAILAGPMGLMFREQPKKAATDPEEADSAGYVDQDRTDHARKCRRIPAGSRDLGLGKSPLTSDC